MKSNKNLIPTILAVIGFMLMWDHFVVSKYTPPKSQAKDAQVATQNQQAVENDFVRRNDRLSPPKASAPAPLETKQVEEFAILKSDDAEVTFGTKGAGVKSWRQP